MAVSEDVLLWENADPKSTYMWDFINIINEKYGQELDGYRALHKWSIDNIADFWGEVWRFTGIRGTPFKQVSIFTLLPRDISFSSFLPFWLCFWWKGRYMGIGKCHTPYLIQESTYVYLPSPGARRFTGLCFQAVFILEWISKEWWKLCESSKAFLPFEKFPGAAI